MKEEKANERERKKKLMAEKKAKLMEEKEKRAKERERIKTLTAAKRTKALATKAAKRKTSTLTPASSQHHSPIKSLEGCGKCGKEENSGEEWVCCDICNTRYHILCTDTPNMTAQEMSLDIWKCMTC
jgi:outer membrane biosynthesis protein TonB